MKITCEFEDTVEVHTSLVDGEFLVVFTWVDADGVQSYFYMKPEKARRLAAALDNKANQAEYEEREDPP